VVFVQPQFDPSSAETLAREIGARVETLDPLAYDWPANLRRVARAVAGTGRTD
jgi:zinc transport system substrate-binding protein